MKSTEKLFLSYQEALLRASRYCAYQERTQEEVRQKLIYEYGQTEAEADEIIADLIEQNFINEERFAKAFAGGKFRIKKWGRLKIRLELEARGLSGYCIRQAMKEIPEADYQKTFYELLDKKHASLALLNTALRKQKLARYLLGKGYESEMVWDALKEYN